MSSFKYFVLVSLALFTIAYAKYQKGVSLYSHTDYDTNDFKCFYELGKRFVGIPIFSYTNWKITSSFATHYQNALKAGFKFIDVIADIKNNGNNNIQTPSYICLSILDALPLDFNGTVWFSIIDNSWDGVIEDKLDFLEGIINHCTALGLNPGIHTMSSIWTEIFSTSSRPRIPNHLSYVSPSEDINFEDFEPFGSWNQTSVKMKEYEIQSSLCGTGVNLLFKGADSLNGAIYLNFDQVHVNYSSIWPKHISESGDPAYDLSQVMNPDMSVNTYGWQSGGYAEQWIDFTMNSTTYIEQLELLPSINTPVGGTNSEASVIVTIFGEDGGIQTITIGKVLNNSDFEIVKVGRKVKKVKITTMKVDSWVGWSRTLFRRAFEENS